MQTYEAPKLITIGTLEDVTLSNKKSSNLDANFPTGTPQSSVTDGTFS